MKQKAESRQTDRQTDCTVFRQTAKCWRYRRTELSRMEFITDLIVIIDEADFKDPGRLRKCLQSYRAERTGSSYKVRGNFEEIEKLSVELLDVRRHINSSPASRDGQTSAQARSVEVSAVVMDYMEQRCENQLNRIRGNSYVIETLPDLRTAHNKAGSTVQVTFRPSSGSMEPVHSDFVRQRFITFYQRTASDLQVTSVPVGPHEHKDLQRRFPVLLFKPSLNKQEVTVTGPFMYVAKLKELLLQNTQSLSRSPIKKVPAVTPSSRASVPSPPHSKDPEDEPCPICMEPIITAQKKTLTCKHSFCRDCLKKAFEYKPVCPTCGQLYGTLTGTQPEGGKMSISKTSSSLPGYEKYGTISIHYYIPSGIQKEEHPNPGQPYDGVSRTAYLPDSSEGQRILKLLKRAFDQRLIFTVGRSTTSGRNNTVTWNDIHHKTSTHGGPTHYGYPDPDYLSRVQDELKVKGIK